MTDKRHSRLTNYVLRAYCLPVAALLVFSGLCGCSGGGPGSGVPVKISPGQVFRSVETQEVLSVRSADEIEVQTKDDIFVCKYSVEKDQRVRLVIDELGTRRVVYCRITDRGLREEKDCGVTYYAPAAYELARKFNVPLIEAAEKGETNTVKSLLDQGADVNGRRLLESGAKIQTPLMVAAACGRLETVQLLLSKGAEDRTSSLAFAVMGGHVDVSKLLLEKGADRKSLAPESLIEAARSGHAGIVKLLLDLGFDPNMKASGFAVGGQSPLWCAVERGHADVAEVLLEKGADANVSLGDKTLLHLAAGTVVDRKPGHDRIVQMLLDHGANVEAQGYLDQTPLMQAAIHENVEAVKILIAKGANVNARDGYGHSVLRAVSGPFTNRDSPVIAILIKAGARDN